MKNFRKREAGLGLLNVKRHLFTTLVAALGVLGMPRLGFAGDGQTLARAYEALSEANTLTKAEHARYARFWSLIDDEVVGALNSGRSAAKMGELLRTFPGYEGPKKATGTQIGSAIFYWDSDLGRDMPTYLLGAPHRNDTALLLGLYNHETFGPGRLSVYRKTGQIWARSSSVDGEGPIAAYPLSGSGSSLAVAIIDSFQAADRSEGTLTIWQERAGNLVRSLPPFKELVDFRVSFSKGLLRITYDHFLAHMCESTMGTRSVYELTVSMRGNNPAVATTFLTPWLDTLERLYSFTASHRRNQARALFKNPADLDVLQPACGEIDEAKGDVPGGRALVKLRDSLHEGRWRVQFEKQDGGVWKIVEVKEID